MKSSPGGGREFSTPGIFRRRNDPASDQERINLSDILASVRWAGIVIVGCRLLVGGVFLAAGLLEIGDPQGMRDAISAYTVLPDGMIGPLALLLPALEIAAGAMLILGLSPRSAAPPPCWPRF